MWEEQILTEASSLAGATVLGATGSVKPNIISLDVKCNMRQNPFLYVILGSGLGSALSCDDKKHRGSPQTSGSCSYAWDTVGCKDGIHHHS